MNAKSLMNATLLTTTFFAAAYPAQAQTALRTERIPAEDVEKGYVVPNRKPIPPTKLASTPSKLQAHEQHLNALGFTLENPNDVWNAAPALDWKLVAEQNKANLAPGLYYPNTRRDILYDTFTKSWQAGSTSSLWTQAKVSLTHSASQSMARVQGEADFNGALLGHSTTLARATADFYAPATGDQSATMNLSVVGQTIWSKSQTGSTATVSDGFDWNGKLWQLGFDWSIAGYGVGAEVYLQGGIGAHFGGSCHPKAAQANADAEAFVGVGGRAWANVGLVKANLDARLDFVQARIDASATTASTKVLYHDAQGYLYYKPVMNVHRYVDANLNFLAGHAIVKVDVWAIFGYANVANWTLWNAPNGLFKWSGVVDNYSKSYWLP